MEPMIILGIDPGTTRVGWAIIQSDAGKVRALDFGCIMVESTDRSHRLLTIYQDISSKITQFTPDCAVIEELFFSTNSKTVISVGEARGVILLSCAMMGVPTTSYTPLTVKKVICGTGTADKKQVQKMVTTTLRLSQVPKPDDTADAIAIALTHAYSYKLKQYLL